MRKFIAYIIIFKNFISYFCLVQKEWIGEVQIYFMHGVMESNLLKNFFNCKIYIMYYNFYFFF